MCTIGEGHTIAFTYINSKNIGMTVIAMPTYHFFARLLSPKKILSFYQRSLSLPFQDRGQSLESFLVTLG